MHRILFCCPVTITPELGTAKVYIEAADGFRRLGWDVVLAGPENYAPGQWSAMPVRERQSLFARFVAARAMEFDVVDFDVGYLPFPRSDFSTTTLLVARSVLLVHHFLRIAIPPRPGLRRWIGQKLFGRARRRELEQAATLATFTCREADLVNLCNNDEVTELTSRGIAAEKLIVLPFGLTSQRRADLEVVALAPPARPCVAFVGTFDPRKGMRDIPRIVATVIEAVADAKFKLLGTFGMLKTAEEVYAEFPKGLRSSIEVVPRFAPSELPALLSDCSTGIFPSAVEGFPFAVLEMLAAGLPVVAYRAPGPPMMLPDDYLVSHGDAAGLAGRVVELLRDNVNLHRAREWARQRSRDFDWNDIAVRTASIYVERLLKLRANGLPARAASSHFVAGG